MSAVRVRASACRIKRTHRARWKPSSGQLIHMNGRVYDYALGRFLSVDPFIQFPLNSQSLNPYSYILNNPLAGTDPTGYLADGIGTICQATGACSSPDTVTKPSDSNRQFALETDNGAKKQGTSSSGTKPPDATQDAQDKALVDQKLQENGVTDKEIKKLDSSCSGYAASNACTTNREFFGEVESKAPAGVGKKDQVNPLLAGRVKFNESGGLLLDRKYNTENLSDSQASRFASKVEYAWSTSGGKVTLSKALPGESSDLTLVGQTSRQFAQDHDLCSCKAGAFIGGEDIRFGRIARNIDTPLPQNNNMEGHEFGHDLGLQHRENGLMNWRGDVDQASPQDLEDVKKIYNGGG